MYLKGIAVSQKSKTNLGIRLIGFTIGQSQDLLNGYKLEFHSSGSTGSLVLASLL